MLAMIRKGMPQVWESDMTKRSHLQLPLIRRVRLAISARVVWAGLQDIAQALGKAIRPAQDPGISYACTKQRRYLAITRHA